jgi:hypothetical protein
MRPLRRVIRPPTEAEINARYELMMQIRVERVEALTGETLQPTDPLLQDMADETYQQAEEIESAKLHWDLKTNAPRA